MALPAYHIFYGSHSNSISLCLSLTIDVDLAIYLSILMNPSIVNNVVTATCQNDHPCTYLVVNCKGASHGTDMSTLHHPLWASCNKCASMEADAASVHGLRCHVVLHTGMVSIHFAELSNTMNAQVTS